MTIITEERNGRSRPTADAPGTDSAAAKPPLVVDPAIPPSVEVALVGHGGKALVPVLVLPGMRICVDGLSADTDAAEWWKDLAVAALYGSLCYQFASGPAR